MTLDITVRGTAEHEYAAERALVSMAIAQEGSDKTEVTAAAVVLQEPITAQLEQLDSRGVVTVWSSDQLRVSAHRPWGPDGQRLDVVHVARVDLAAEFVDFERLSGFLDYWAGRDGVEIGEVTWDVTARNRRHYEAEARKAAVDDAVAKAQVLANAVRRGKVTPVRLADVGMLDGGGDGPVPKLARLAAADAGGEGLDLKPRRIVIQVGVDAQFVAE